MPPCYRHYFHKPPPKQQTIVVPNYKKREYHVCCFCIYESIDWNISLTNWFLLFRVFSRTLVILIKLLVLNSRHRFKKWWNSYSWNCKISLFFLQYFDSVGCILAPSLHAFMVSTSPDMSSLPCILPLMWSSLFYFERLEELNPLPFWWLIISWSILRESWDSCGASDWLINVS